MAKVTLHHYNWRKGRSTKPENMFNITLSAPQNLVQEAWRDGLYEAVLMTDETDALLPSNICENMFMKENADTPKPRRSMSVGDVVQINNDYYLCAMMGFEKIIL